MTAADIEALKKTGSDSKTTVFDLMRCPHCGCIHLRACPRVKRMRFRPSGDSRLVEVEFWPEGQWSTAGLITPEMVFGAIREQKDVADGGQR